MGFETDMDCFGVVSCEIFYVRWSRAGPAWGQDGWRAGCDVALGGDKRRGTDGVQIFPFWGVLIVRIFFDFRSFFS
jgi:hypothetical protein